MNAVFLLTGEGRQRLMLTGATCNHMVALRKRKHINYALLFYKVSLTGDVETDLMENHSFMLLKNLSFVRSDQTKYPHRVDIKFEHYAPVEPAVEWDAASSKATYGVIEDVIDPTLLNWRPFMPLKESETETQDTEDPSALPSDTFKTDLESILSQPEAQTPVGLETALRTLVGNLKRGDQSFVLRQVKIALAQGLGIGEKQVRIHVQI